MYPVFGITEKAFFVIVFATLTVPLGTILPLAPVVTVIVLVVVTSEISKSSI
ncbi:hypothetical protein SDC9_141061 [bioreactor metagenome]|uniref:Uncharacterized protein n=1 Tax=bioreactor metagenome TaxID=1076179 RepID=A0A645DXC3_9ZZZZ